MRTQTPPSTEQTGRDVASTGATFKFDSIVKGAECELTWKDLSETEKSAASLGVDPNAWKPISFMNQAHYDALLKKNAIDSELAKKLEAFRYVSTSVA